MKREFLLGVPMLLLGLLVSACTPLVLPTADEPVARVAVTPTASAEEPDLSDSATATVSGRSLRVRSEPSETAEVIAGIKENEKYKVLGISSDGLWVQLAIDSAPGGSGWVSSSFVTVEGPITDAATIEVPVASSPLTLTAAITGTGTTSPTVMIRPTPAPGFAVVRTDGTRLRVRGGPSVDTEIVGYVYNNESYQVEEVSADGQWVHISGSTDADTDNPNGGWVAAEFVAVGQ